MQIGLSGEVDLKRLTHIDGLGIEDNDDEPVRTMHNDGFIAKTFKER